ncbi:hypothetical protein GCM10025768_24520 [Microbacterium pseudoresistens]|uniref:Putative membrane protein YgcG n=1 Tax=Microbacterium pseudoresistens TaxID=640634 RepID=A0A7Y9EWU6_9MICO|nr:DUF2207 domain-containing protein [Microbacterium pseudoresistens]NYD55339.1 putative membrane protein YgcG [Microbacterium pseudoresistens]
MSARLRNALLSALGASTLIAAPLILAPAANAGVDDFSYDSWDALYELGLNDEGRASLHVTETVVAHFPEIDQNRGIVRGLAERYFGAPLWTDVLSIRDENGADVPYEEDSDDDVLYLSIDDDTYKHGPTTYVIEYTMRDVMHRPDDADVDEFYWDLLPLDSTQPIDEFSARIVFDDALVRAATGAMSCYQGRYGSTDSCELTPDTESAEHGYRVQAHDLAAGEGVSVAFAFAPGTVTPSPAAVADPSTDLLPFGLGAGALALVPALGFTARGMQRRKAAAQGRGIVVAQYEVPADLPPSLAAHLVRARGAAVPAEIVHLGVHGALQIQDGTRKPVLVLDDPSAAVEPLDAYALKALFPVQNPGERLDLGIADNNVVTRLQGITTTAEQAGIERGLIRKARSRLAVGAGMVGVALALAAIGFAIPGMIVGRESSIAAFVISCIVLLLSLILTAVLSRRQSLLTPAGAERAEHLEGVKEFIRVAEADRLRMLQSYSGAERQHDGGVDTVVLYEKLLPYAMLFGMEREWGDVLDLQYEQQHTAPSWYTGYALGSFGSSLTDMGGTLHATPVATSSSSSSSGSFGGGFSGGGGGGGFSGGR